MNAAARASTLRLEGERACRTAGATVRWIVDPPGSGAWNMAVDVALARGMRTVPAIRLYGFRPPCLSLGRHQRALGRYDPERLRDRGIDVVRRPTGGGAVLHDDEVTYALALPARAWSGPRATLCLVHAAILHALRALGVAARLADGRPRRAPDGACFSEPAPGEIVVADRKLVGSAQARIGGALLQHGSILLGGGQELAESRDERGARAVAAPFATATLESELGARPERAALLDALAAGFRSVLGAELLADTLSEGERILAARELERFLDPGWTWRR
jgi:lipoate-protein ligase A